MKKTMTKVIAMLAVFGIMFTSVPMLGGELNAEAATNRINVTATCNGWTNTVALRWNRISNPQQGYAVIVNGKVWKHLGKWTNYYAVKGLKSDTKYTFRVRTWKKVRSKMWFNTSTRKWQWTDPGWKYRGRTTYGMRIVYGTCSPAVYKTTAKAKYTIRYDANGGTGAPANGVKTQNVAFKVSTQRPSKAGYRFTGWTIVETGYKNLQPGKYITASSNRSYTLKAQWVRVYTIRYHANGGSGAPDMAGKAHGSAFTVSNVVPTYSGHKFIGWMVRETGLMIAPGGIISAGSNANYNLDAQWEEIPEYSTIRFRNYNGTVLQEKTIKSGTMPEYTWNTPRKSSDANYDYVFERWDPPVVIAEGDADYKAVFMKVPKDASGDNTGGNTGDNTGDNTSGGTVVPTPGYERVTLTNYRGEQTVVLKANGKYYKNEDFLEIDRPMKESALILIDRTIDGEFTDNNGTWIQKNGVTFRKKDILNQTEPHGSSDPYTLRFMVIFFNGDPDKLEFEIENSIRTVHSYNYMFEPTDYEYITVDGENLVEYWGTQSEVNGNCVTKELLIGRLANSFMRCGFVTGDINITIKYDGEQIGSITYNPTGSNGSMYPERQKYLDIARAAVEANGGPKSLQKDLYAIEDYIYKNYTYDEMNCIDGFYALESWSYYQYGVTGFSGPGVSVEGESNYGTHSEFHLDSDPTIHYSAQGHH